MKINRIRDKYNSKKIWLLKVSSCSHYYLNQENCGQKLNRGFKRVTKHFLIDIGISI